jgi:hypothetical protein
VGIQSDGKIVGAGQWRDVTTTNTNVLITRLLPNGTVDSSFGTGGSTKTNYSGYSDYGYGLAIQSDDKSVVVGYIGSGAPAPNYGLTGVLRYLP